MSILGFVTDNPSPMPSLRDSAVLTNVSLFVYGCADHAGHLVAKGLAMVEPFRPTLRTCIRISVSFTRSTRAGPQLRSNAQQLRETGSRVPSLRPYSRTRWVGEASTVSSVSCNLVALRRTLLEIRHMTAPIRILDLVLSDISGLTTRLALSRCTPFLNTRASWAGVSPAAAVRTDSCNCLVNRLGRRHGKEHPMYTDKQGTPNVHRGCSVAKENVSDQPRDRITEEHKRERGYRRRPRGD